MAMGYAYQKRDFSETKLARAKGIALPISLKHSVEVCKYLRHKQLSKAIEILDDIIELKKPVPYTRFTGDLAHKRAIGPGRYPKKTAKYILWILESVEANARFKGLNMQNLEIIHLHAHQASRPFHYGRQSRTKMKRTHIEVIVAEKGSRAERQSEGTKTQNKEVPNKKQ